MDIVRLAILFSSLGFSSLGTSAWAQGVPSRQIPPSVLNEMSLLENRFELALAADCDAKRCFSKGCTYLDHAVADQPRSSSLPGLGEEAGPGSVAPQEYLTRARCSFVHEASVEGADVQSLVRRLQSKLSKGWLVVTIDRQALEPIPPQLQLPPELVAIEPPQEEPALAPETLTASAATRELWTNLLPHFYWMIGVILLTLAGLTLVWAWRRVGRESLEERAMLAALSRTDGDDTASAGTETASVSSEEDRAFVARQTEAWAARLDAVAKGNHNDPELQALIRELLRTRDLPLLTKAVMQFPDSFLAVFPTGGDIAAAKLELADYLKSVDLGALPSDIDFFRALDRHARAAALISQSDAQLVRSLREEFGAAGIVSLIGCVQPRTASLLFALAPAEEQHEMVRLLSARQMGELAEQLLRSNRMAKAETAYLFRVLDAARLDEALPPAPSAGEVSDRGAEFDAAGALSVLLQSLPSDQRKALFGETLDRFHGSLPTWYRTIFLPDMLFAISDEARTDLLLEVDAETLAAWLSMLDTDTRDRLIEDLPDSLRTSVASAVFPSRARLLALSWRARQDLARGFQQQLARANIPFEHVVGRDGS